MEVNLRKKVSGLIFKKDEIIYWTLSLNHIC